MKASIDPRELNFPEQSVYTSAFGWSSAWGHDTENCRHRAERAVLQFREQMSRIDAEAANK